MNELKQKIQQEQTEQVYVQQENAELKSEIMMIKQQLNMSNNIQEQLRAQLFDLKDKVGDAEHKEFIAHSQKDLMQKEIQQLRMQLQQANSFIQQQSMFYGQMSAGGGMGKPPVFQVPTNSGGNGWDDRDSESTFSRESAVPNISPPVSKRNPAN